MEIWRAPMEFRRACDEARQRGARVGLVPTMGALHRGHQTLIEEARKRADFVVVSIFVNPTQFGPNEDFSRYPRDLEGDAKKCAEAGAHGIFAPAPADMYPPGDETRVHVGATAAGLCGAHRPGHFEGVATVVTKLFALVGPSLALFGRKDYQQLKVIERFTRDLFLPVEVEGVRTVREPDGLAMSSRNAYLSAEARAQALALPRGLSAAARAFAAGERRAGMLTALARGHITPVASAIDYVDVADADTLAVLGPEAHTPDRVLLAVAVRIGGARLIDNLVLGEDPSPLGLDESKEGDEERHA
ncbi:pantoate--beta-alanine ligase [Polyangium mundeleinium]|uniref:Pantothenate synthetase n=1 Tax=Polyangium mundeleinium TaxID=2995306 RepID=A0ABT5EKK2_9BACT|nr:pantoate--beta-alanine ligase [Polyangium mundeleinium]MDC0741999.1 pantoate--beta-alanine ligase [Polyangium mundeleinium]